MNKFRRRQKRQWDKPSWPSILLWALIKSLFYLFVLLNKYLGRYLLHVLAAILSDSRWSNCFRDLQPLWMEVGLFTTNISTSNFLFYLREFYFLAYFSRRNYTTCTESVTSGNYWGEKIRIRVFNDTCVTISSVCVCQGQTASVFLLIFQQKNISSRLVIQLQIDPLRSATTRTSHWFDS